MRPKRKHGRRPGRIRRHSRRVRATRVEGGADRGTPDGTAATYDQTGVSDRERPVMGSGGENRGERRTCGNKSNRLLTLVVGRPGDVNDGGECVGRSGASEWCRSGEQVTAEGAVTSNAACTVGAVLHDVAERVDLRLGYRAQAVAGDSGQGCTGGSDAVEANCIDQIGGVTGGSAWARPATVQAPCPRVLVQVPLAALLAANVDERSPVVF